MTIETTSHAQRVPPIHPDQTVAGQALRLRAMEMRLGRKIRVLHIGNIANNAFHNAKLLLKAGIECDVLCYDYYHMMGCPEWEDADFDGDIGNDFRPNWAGVNLNGYQRPRWFVQGPLGVCMDYLEARLGVGVIWPWYLLLRPGLPYGRSTGVDMRMKLSWPIFMP